MSRKLGAIQGKQAPVRATQIDIPNVKAIRDTTGLSQRSAANMIGVSLRTLQNRQQSRRTSDKHARALLLVIKKNAMVVKALGN